MLSNHYVIKAINNLLKNRQFKTILIVSRYVILLIIIWLFMRRLELNSLYFQKAHEYLKTRELDDGLIRYAYITLSIGVLSIGSIMFTLLFGKIQSLINEVNYSSFHRKTYTDGKILNNYILLMSISIILLINYLVADTSAYPLTFLIILLFAFFTVVLILNSLFTSLFDDLNLFRILEKNYKTVTWRFEEFKRLHTKLKNFIEIEGKFNAYQKEKPKFKKLEKRIDSLKSNLETLSNLHYTECIQSLEELNYFVVNACRRKDPELLRVVFDYTEEHIKHHIEILNYSMDESINFWSNYVFGKSYKFVVHNCLSIFEKPELQNSDHNLTEIGHDRFSHIIRISDFFEPRGKEISDSDFGVFYGKFLNMTIRGINDKSSLELLTYKLDNTYMLEKMKFNSIAKYQLISFGNITLLNELTAFKKIIGLQYIFEVQSKILNLTSMNKGLWPAHKIALIHFFDLFEKYINRIDDIKSVDIMSTVSSCLDIDDYDSIPHILSAFTSSIDSSDSNVKSSRIDYEASSLLLKQLGLKSKSISRAIRLDERVYFGFSNILIRVMDILRKYLRFERTPYNLRTFEKALIQYCDYLSIYNGFDNSRAFNEMEDTFNKLFRDVHIKEITTKAYVNLVKKVVNNEMAISKSIDKTNVPFQSTINIEGVISQMYGFENNLYEFLVNQLELNLSKNEMDFLLEHIGDLIIELKSELTKELISSETTNDAKKSEYKEDLNSLIYRYMEASNEYADIED